MRKLNWWRLHGKRDDWIWFDHFREQRRGKRSKSKAENFVVDSVSTFFSVGEIEYVQADWKRFATYLLVYVLFGPQKALAIASIAHFSAIVNFSSKLNESSFLDEVCCFRLSNGWIVLLPGKGTAHNHITRRYVHKTDIRKERSSIFGCRTLEHEKIFAWVAGFLERLLVWLLKSD